MASGTEGNTPLPTIGVLYERGRYFEGLLLYCLPTMFHARRDHSRLRRLAPAGLTILGLLALVLATSSYGVTSKTVEPKYRHVVSMSAGGTTTSGSTPVNASLPRISGEARQGTMLSASNGSWDNSPDSYTYQWRRCGSAGGNCSNISGASSNRYVLRAADVSRTIRVVVTASNSLGSASAASARTAVVLSKTAPPANWNGMGCLGYHASGIPAFVCNYNMASPFKITGSSNGGPRTVSYFVQCRRFSLTSEKIVMYPRVWFRRSIKVKKGHFKIYGAKATFTAARHCVIARRKQPVLTITGAHVISMTILLDDNLPWGK